MAATASDIRDALSLGPAAPRKPSAASRAGISRELYSLIGDSAPPLVVRAPRFKARPDLGRPKARWALNAFSHPARSDGLQLKHWERTTPNKKTKQPQPPDEYRFAKFSQPCTVYEYTDEEYAEYLEDAEWSKDETDYLMRLIKGFDARFYVINDRYEYSNGVERSIDDLKQRYYTIVRKLLKHRPLEDGESDKERSDLIQTYQFDIHRELQRKNYVRGLMNRTPEQVQEEEALFLLCKRLEQTEKKFARERDTLLRHLAGIDSGLPNLPLDEEPFSAISQQQAAEASRTGAAAGGASRNRKRKSDIADIDSPGATPTAAKKINLAKQAIDDEKHCIIRTDGGSLASTKSAHQAAYLRSQRIPTPKSNNAAKIKEALAELQINFDRLVMPTRDTINQLDTLLEAAGQLVEAKRALDRIDSEIRIMKQKRGEPVDADMPDAT